MKVRGIDCILYEVVDMERSTAFYRDTLGLELVHTTPEGRVIFKPAPDSQAALVLCQEDADLTADTRESGAYAVLVVDNVVEVVEELKGQEVPVLLDAVESPDSWYAIVADPDGNRVALYQKKELKEIFSIGQASETLERYYGRKLQGKGNVGISDIADIEGGLSNYMYSLPRSRLIISTPGCSFSHLANDSADLSGSRSTGS